MEEKPTQPFYNSNDSLFREAEKRLKWLENPTSYIFSSKLIEIHHLHSFQSSFLQSQQYLHEVSIQTRKPVCYYPLLNGSHTIVSYRRSLSPQCVFVAVNG